MVWTDVHRIIDVIRGEPELLECSTRPRFKRSERTERVGEDAALALRYHINLSRVLFMTLSQE
jgi:hypothetical protein